MVGFVERFRKPNLPIVLGSPQKDGVIHQQAAHRPQNITLPVLRNFSYPTNITTRNRPPFTSPAWGELPSTWNQLGEICNFSPDTVPRTRQDRATGLEDPFFYTTDRTPFKQPADCDEKLGTRCAAKQSTDSVCPSQQAAVGKRQRRSTLLGLSSSQGHGPRDKDTNIKNNLSSDHIFSQKRNITARLKRTSLGHHKTYSSFDTPRFFTPPLSSFERPMSSSGVPLVDTRLARSTSTATDPSVSLLLFSRDIIKGSSENLEKATLIPYVLSEPYVVGMEPSNSKGSSRGVHHVAQGSQELSRDQRCTSRASEPYKRKGKEGKSRWFSQLKEWVSVSEPSTQALKDYKKDTYKKAGIALDDPLANAKLHLPAASLPPDAIKPGGNGPEPEEIVLQRAMQRKKARELLPMAGVSRESRSSASHCSSLSGVTVGALKDGE
ncbi:hypothetical protein GGR58DRAFT_529087 [Xylaria digitata]|nr:hypothetical protein GGR58DRAFT_529087 [Xylaria digitata]